MTTVKRIALTAACTLLAGALVSEPASARKVANPGSMTITSETGTIRVGDNDFDFDSSNPILFQGSVSGAGVVTIPRANIVFPDQFVSASGYDFRVRITANDDATGSVNPMTGLTALNASLRIDIDPQGSSPPGFGSDCRITPVNVALSSVKSGGVPYDTTTGRVTVADHGFFVPGAQGCGGFFGIDYDDEINDSIGIPTSDTDAVITARTTPILQEGVNASFTAAPSSGFEPLTVNFDASASTAAAGVEASGYRWDFDGNGTFDRTTTDPTTSFTYDEPGVYQAKLRVTDVEGDFDETTRTITVNAAVCTITGTVGPDVLNGTPGDDVICGRGGNDTLRGEGGNDLLLGEGDDDVLDGGPGADGLSGGEGTDRASYATRVSAVAVSIGAGSGDDGAAGEGDTVSGDMEDVRGGSGNDSLTGDDDPNLLLGEAGNDRLFGERGPDDLRGDSRNAQGGADEVHGGAGPDKLRGYAGEDEHFGEEGNDTLYSDAGADSLSGGDGIDSAYYAGRAGPLSVTVGSGIGDDGGLGEGDTVEGDVEKVSGGSGDDVLTGNANPLGTVLLAGAGDDLVDGGGGPKDLLVGEAGTDRLDTQDGDASDTLSCGAGIDAFLADPGDRVNADCEPPQS